MRSSLKFAVVFVLVAAAEAAPVAAILALALSCTASTIEQESLLPAMRAAWPPIREDIAIGAETSGLDERNLRLGQADALGAALQLGDRGAAAAVPWPVLEELAGVGIRTRVTRGEIGPGVALSFEERLRQFSSALGTYLSGGN